MTGGESSFPPSVLNVLERDVYAAMGYRDTVPDSPIVEMVGACLAETRGLCRPRRVCRIIDAKVVGKSRISIGDKEFQTGGIINSYLEGMTQACLFITTAGAEFEEHQLEVKRSGDILKEFVVDSIGSVVAESCVEEIGKELGRVSSLPHSLPYSPGYCGWHIKEQVKLFSFFEDKPCGVSLGDSFLMSPVKSVSGFFALGEKLSPMPYRCAICNNVGCFKRKEL